MQSFTLEHEYAAARIAELREAACHERLVRKARRTRSAASRFSLRFLPRR